MAARRLCRLPPRLFPLVCRLPRRRRPETPPPPLRRGSSSSMVVVGSADSFASILTKVQDEKLPAVFYYTAVWCGPCRAIAPFISQLSRQYPNIPVYKVDIDMEGLGSKLGDLKVYSVPTFHFYLKGQKTSEIVGADAKKLEVAMESLHKFSYSVSSFCWTISCADKLRQKPGQAKLSFVVANK